MAYTTAACHVWFRVIRPRSQTCMTTWWLSEAKETHICRLHRPAHTRTYVLPERGKTATQNNERQWRKMLEEVAEGMQASIC